MTPCGGGLQSPLFGTTPDLEDLVQGDVKHRIDFRSVYATVLQDWLGAAPTPILRGHYETLPLYRKV